MNGKVKIVALAALAIGVVVFAVLLAPRMDAGGPKPTANIPLAATFRQLFTAETPSDRILGDDKGPYLHNVASTGSVSVHLVSPHWQNGGNFYMELDSAGNEILGRTVGFLFYTQTHPCLIDGVPPSVLEPDFDIGLGSSVVKTRSVQFKTWYRYLKDPTSPRYYESLEVLNFTAMQFHEIAYVGMSICFKITLTNGGISDEYWVGFRWDPVEVEALAVDPSGSPTQWAIRPIRDPAVYQNIQQKLDDPNSQKTYVPSRMLVEIHYATGGKKNQGPKAQCYGIWAMPFELILNRM
jgi:hypothetical protein